MEKKNQILLGWGNILSLEKVSRTLERRKKKNKDHPKLDWKGKGD